MEERFFAALAEDFNTPAALAVLAEWVSEANRGMAVGRDGLAGMLQVLGLETLLARDAAGPPAAVEALARERDAARTTKDWAASDRLRDAIAAQGWIVRDVPGGHELVPAG